mmetsp:Transcript_54346/g.129500  ORF Transcript_54346/g.129500 Transcript_54346/m.129500 type:complete len:373 (+) Transcript_54346:96-1214(+)
MANKQANLVFEAITVGDVGYLETLAGYGADFNCHHPETGHTTLQAVIMNFLQADCLSNPMCYLFTDSDRAEEAETARKLERKARQLAEWLVLHGASPCLEAKECRANKALTCCVRMPHLHRYHERRDIHVHTKGHSAVSMLVKLRFEMKQDTYNDADEWDEHVTASFADKMVQSVLSPHSSDFTSRLSVKTSVLELWEKMRADGKSHDLTIQCVNGDATAHAHVLAASSPVVAAMLSSGMQEALRKTIAVDCTVQGVEFLLDLVYTGTSSKEFAVEIGLPALDLAHCWQLCDVLQMLEQAAAKVLSTENFGEVAEAAVLKDLGQLKAACLRFSFEKKEVRDKPLPAAVSTWLNDGKPIERKSKNLKKRRVTY